MKKSGWINSEAVVFLFATSLLAGPARAQAPANVTVNVFQGGFNWPCFVGQQKGFFERNGITVTLQPTPNSVAQMTGLAEGKFDIAITAFDNIVAYVEGQGEAPIGPQPEFFAFMGSDNGFLSLVAEPERQDDRRLERQDLVGRCAHDRLCLRAVRHSQAKWPARERLQNRKSWRDYDALGRVA